MFLWKETHNKWLTKTFSTELLFHGSLLPLEEKMSVFFGFSSLDSKWINCVDNFSWLVEVVLTDCMVISHCNYRGNAKLKIFYFVPTMPLWHSPVLKYVYFFPNSEHFSQRAESFLKLLYHSSTLLECLSKSDSGFLCWHYIQFPVISEK